MNPYVVFAIAMCGIVLLSLFATAYLAARFNRAAKRDLSVALDPLAAMLNGQVDVDEALVSGRYAGHLASGAVIRAPNTMGRLFQSEIIDSAGGESWMITRDRTSKTGEVAPLVCRGTDSKIDDWYAAHADEIERAIADGDGSHRVEYVASAGALRLSRPMRARRDVASPGAFCVALDLLVNLGPVNRSVQGAPDGDWPGGRSPSSVALADRAVE